MYQCSRLGNGRTTQGLVGRLSITVLLAFCSVGFVGSAVADPPASADAGKAIVQGPDELARKILQDKRMEAVLQMGHELLESGMTAGSNYDQVWIRDLNTFIVPLMDVASPQSVREALLTFLHFQDADGNIVDGYVPIATAKKRKYQRVYRYTPTRPGLKAHKNTVETDQESSLIQAFSRYVRYTNDTSILDEVVRDVTVRERLEMALSYPLTLRFSERYGLVWGATTPDWGDIQPEHPKGNEFDQNSHRAINIYNNALLMIAIEDYVDTIVADDAALRRKWQQIHGSLRDAAREHLWDDDAQKFIPHIFLDGSPFPEDFDESEIFYHGGTAVAIEAGLLGPDEIAASLEQMRENVRQAGASSIGLNFYPIYPEGLFLSRSMRPWYYMNGGDWTWFGGRMVRELTRNGFPADAFRELEPMMDRVLAHGGFYEWWTRDNEPMGAKDFKGSAGVLVEAIVELRNWAQGQAEGL